MSREETHDFGVVFIGARTENPFCPSGQRVSIWTYAVHLDVFCVSGHALSTVPRLVISAVKIFECEDSRLIVV